MLADAMKRPGIMPALDGSLLWSVILLLAIGLVMVYSASIALPDSARFASLRTTHHLMRHSFSVCVGLTCGLIAFAIPIQRWQRAAPWLFVTGLILLMLVLVPGSARSCSEPGAGFRLASSICSPPS